MNYPKPDPDAPLGSPQHPIHASTLARIVDATDYTPPGGGVWAKTVAGTAFHQRQADVCNGAPHKTAAQYLDAALAEERGPIAWGRHTHETLAREIEAWSRTIDLVHRPSARTACKAEVAFRFHDESTGLWYEGELDEVQFGGTNKQITGVGVTDYKTGEKAPDTRLHPQHHLYCLGVLYGVLSIGVPYHAEVHLLDWSGETGDPWRLNLWPQAFRYFHLPSLLARGSWNMLALATDGSLMSEPNSREYIRKLTKQLLDAQPQRVAVAVTAKPTIETETMGNPQTTAIIPAQNHKVALEVSENIDVFQLGEVFSKSKFFKDCADANQAVVKILAGRELGLPPFQSMSGIHVIQGKATMGATLIAARIKGSGKYDYTVNQMADTKCEVEFFELRDGKRISIGKSEFSDADARKAGTQNMGKFPRNMLFARAISNGAKWFTPDIFGGPIYVPEEMQQDEPAAEPIKSVAVEVAPAPEQPVAPQFTWGEPRGEGFATDAQIKRIKANCDALGFGPKKVLVTAVNLGAPKEITSVADVTEKVATQLVLKLDALLKSTETPRPEREKTEAERVEEQVRQIVGELRTKRAKELAELVRNSPLSANEIIDIMANEAAPNMQFSALAEPQQEQVLHTIKQAAQFAAERVAMAASNGNGHH